MNRHLWPSSHLPQHVLAPFRYHETQLRGPFRRIFGLIPSCARGIIELRMAVVAIAAQIPQVCHHTLVRRHELGRLHDRKSRFEALQSSHALVDDGFGSSESLEVPPNVHGPHVRAMGVLGNEVASMIPLDVGGQPPEVRAKGRGSTTLQPSAVGSHAVDRAESLHAGAWRRDDSPVA